MKGYGFGDRSGIELPSETRGLLRNPRKWGATSIGSMAIGQEIGVTPVQLVTMVSTIANGGVYMPPHVLLESVDAMKGDPRLQPMAFHPANQLPATPTVGASKYGGAVSAPVFADVAQQVLEYLGVPHDQPLKEKKELLASAKKDALDEGPSENGADLNAMFADVNSLPADDPLRMPANAAAAAVAVAAEKATAPVAPKAAGKTGILNLLPAKVLSAFQAKGGTGSARPDAAEASAQLPAPKIVPVVQVKEKGTVVVDAGLRVAVPSFEGAGLRGVVEKADAVGLRVQPVGSGLAREQVPAAGTMVPAGTEVVVRFTR